VLALLALVPSIGVSTSVSAATAQAAESASDPAITSKVKAAIDADAELKGANVTVATSGGVVTLQGTMASAVTRLKLVEKARAVEGVAKVVNKVKIGKK